MSAQGRDIHIHIGLGRDREVVVDSAGRLDGGPIGSIGVVIKW